jgi:hypothetical protein
MNRKDKNSKNEEEDKEAKILFEKNGFRFFKNDSKYCCTFSIINDKIHLPPIINFELIKIIHALNPDISERIELDNISENEVNCFILVKNLFQDLGLPQKYTFLNIKKVTNNNTILFHAFPKNMELEYKRKPVNSESANIHSIKCICDIVTNHEIKLTFDIYLQDNFYIPPFLEKMIGLIIYKLFNRVKQFIENITI